MNETEETKLLQYLYGANKSLFYDCLEQVANNAYQKYRKNDPDAELYRFQKDDGLVNLIAVRGLRSRVPINEDEDPSGIRYGHDKKLEYVEPSKRGNKIFDDTMFVVFKKDGVKTFTSSV